VFANVLSFYQKTIKTILFKAEPMTDRTVHNSTRDYDLAEKLSFDRKCHHGFSAETFDLEKPRDKFIGNA